MANTERIQKAIELMEFVRDKHPANFDMTYWQSTLTPLNPNAKENIATVLECGSTCCLSGWIAVDPYFQENGGSIGKCGYAIYMGKEREEAIAEWFEIADSESELLTGYAQYTDDNEPNTCNYYGVDYYHEITPDMVIKKLKTFI